MNNKQREQQMITAAEAYAEEVGYKDEHDLCNTLNVFCAGWRAADNSRWIPVERELPPPDPEYEGIMSVDCYITDGVDAEISYYNYNNDTWDDDRLSGKVTHWYIPTPPARKEE